MNNSSEDNLEYDDIITVNDFKAKELLHYKMLNDFFNNCTINEIQLIINIIHGNHLISLRFLDWFVTRYCYLYKLVINVDNIYNNEKDFNINISYKAQLKSFKKKYFDPFRRKKKFYYSNNKKDIIFLTTLGQLNFFKWIIINDILKYTETNFSLIMEKYDHVNKYFKKNGISNDNSSSSDVITKSINSSDSITSIDNKPLSKNSYPHVIRNIFLEL